jgi:hypothetical protein
MSRDVCHASRSSSWDGTERRKGFLNLLWLSGDYGDEDSEAGRDGQQDILCLSGLLWLYFAHLFTSFHRMFFSLQIASHWKLQIEPEVCLGSGVSHRKGGLQILVDKDTGDGVDGRAELEVERVEPVERVLECFVPV